MSILDLKRGVAAARPRIIAVSVPSGATGSIYMARRRLGPASQLSLAAGTNANLSFSAGAIVAQAALGSSTQTAIVREELGLLVLQYPIIFTGVVAIGGGAAIQLGLAGAEQLIADGVAALAWGGMGAVSAWDTDQIVTDVAGLRTAFASVRATSATLTKRHRIVLDWTGVSTDGTATVDLNGLSTRADGWLDNGGGVLLVAATGKRPAIGNNVAMRSTRGLHTKGVGFAAQWSGSGQAETQFCLQVQFSGTWNASSVVLVESAGIGADFWIADLPETQLIGNFATSGANSGVADYIEFKDCTFRGGQNLVKCQARVTKITGCDHEFAIQDFSNFFGHTSGSAYYAYIWLERNTYRRPADGLANRGNHMDVAQTGTLIDTHLGYRVRMKQCYAHAGHSYAGGPGGGGTQGAYNDDHREADNLFVIDRGMMFVSSPSAFAMFSPRATYTSYIDAMTLGRAGRVPSGLPGDGFAAQDFTPGILVTMIDGTIQLPADDSPWLVITNTAAGLFPAASPKIVRTSCELIDYRVSAAGGSAAPENFFVGRDFTRAGPAANGMTNKFGYDLPGEGGTQAQFVADLWANYQGKAAYAGRFCPDPTGITFAAPTRFAQVVQSATIVMPADVWAFGASSMDGGQIPTTGVGGSEDALTNVMRAVESLPSGSDAYTTDPVSHTGPGAIDYVLSGPNAGRRIRNRGSSGSWAGPATNDNGGAATNIVKVMNSQASGFGASDFIIAHQGDNGVPTSTPSPVELLASGYAAMRMNIGARPFVEIVNTQGSINTGNSAYSEPAGSFYAFLKAASLRAQQDLFPGRVFSFHQTLLTRSTPTDANDTADLNVGAAPRSYMMNDGSHQIAKGYNLQSDVVLTPMIDGWAGGTPFPLDQVVEGTTPTSPAAGDVVGSIVAYGTGGSFALDVSNTQTTYAISASGQITRIGSALPTRDVTYAAVRTSKVGRFDKVQPRVGIAERAAPGVSKMVEFDGYSIIGMPDTKLANSAKATLLFRARAIDATAQNIMGMLGSTVLNIRLTANNIDIVWKSVAGATIFSKSTTGGLFANADRWVAVCIDLSNPAAEITKLVTWAVPGTSTLDQTLAAALTADTTTQHLVRLDAPFAIGNNTASGSAAATWAKGRVGDLAIWDDHVDFAVVVNQQVVSDAAGLPQTAWVAGDGAVDGKVPRIRRKGNAWDWRVAREQGSLKPATPGAPGQYWGFNNRLRPDGELGYLKTV